jgi:hypothetical protein
MKLPTSYQKKITRMRPGELTFAGGVSFSITGRVVIIRTWEG